METSFYKPEQDEIVIFFLNELKKNISENLKNVILYGSRARGDFFKHSDYDFLIILKKKNLQIKELIYDIGYEVLDVFEKLASCI
ncbi:MAG: nucleotidyltransferase domain-containing protein, partial [Leptospiraceae bacterium]|nr:nucleotidyltransferase domain-containing protein [Leptospiraceae bacterium]